ncbi:MAG TPA: hypothetical protein DIC34_20275 [Treponema sp.]|nr:hypothetical protein [Treponema sp.]
MDEIGRVIKIEGKTITVKGGELGGCFGCVNEECRTNGNLFTASNQLDLPLAVGSLVEARASAGKTAGQAVVVFLPPVIAFAAAFAGVSIAFPESSEAARAAAGVVGLALGFLGIYLMRKVSPTGSMPEIVRIVSEDEYEAATATPVAEEVSEAEEETVVP